MKKLKTLGFFFLCIFFTYKGLCQIKCASDVDLALIQQVNPSRYQRILALEQFTQNYITSVNNGNNTARLTTPNSTIIIPVVVHVLHRGEIVGLGINISDAQIQSQIAVLNEDFRRLNADRVNTPAIFQPIASDPNFEFRLACIDPNGNQTTGITRTLTNTVQFQPLNNKNADGSINEQATGIKFTSQGGRDAWATNRYLNIWVCDMGGDLLGYGQYPDDYSTKPTTDGVVMRFNAFGRVGNLSPGFNLGRVCSHEIGHWLNLRHIWGDANCGNDFVDDTPIQQRSNLGCPNFPHPTCNNGVNGDMFMNFMDYSDDVCMNIYTRGQSLRMRAIFATVNGTAGPRAAFINNYFSVNEPANSICTTGSVSASNPACLPIIWNVVSGPATIIGGQGTNNITLRRNTNGNGFALIRAIAGGYTDDKNVKIGNYDPPAGTTYVTSNYYYTSQTQILTPQFWFMPAGQTGYVTYTITDPAFTPTFWTPISGNTPIISTDKRTIQFSISTGQTASYQLTAQGPCGTFIKNFGATVMQGGGGFSVTPSPNPASESLKITISNESKEVKALNATGNILISLYDFYTNKLAKLWSFKNNQKQFSLNVSVLKKGQYILVVSKGKYKQSQQILIGK